MQEGFLIVGRGLGQVMFQNNAVSGLLMLVGIACNSWLLALLALLGNFVGTVTAFFSGYSKEDIEDGLYGFNGTLVGIAVGVFMEPGGGFPPFVGGGFHALHMDSPRVRLSETSARFHGSFHPCRMVVAGPLPWVVPLIVVIFCDAGRNGSRLVPGL